VPVQTLGWMMGNANYLESLLDRIGRGLGAPDV